MTVDVTFEPACLLNSILAGVATVIDEATLQFSPDHLRIKHLDVSHVAFIDFLLPKQAFSNWSVTGNVNLTFNVDEVLKILGLNDDSFEQVRLKYAPPVKGNPECMTITLSGRTEKEYSLPLLENPKLDNLTPKLAGSTCIVSLAPFLELLESAEKMANPFQLALTEKRNVEISCHGDAGRYMGTMRPDDVQQFQGIPAQTCFNVNFVLPIVRLFTKIAELDHITPILPLVVELQTDMPLKLTLNLPCEYGETPIGDPVQNMVLTYVLAPRIDKEEVIRK